MSDERYNRSGFEPFKGDAVSGEHPGIIVSFQEMPRTKLMVFRDWLANLLHWWGDRPRWEE